MATATRNKALGFLADFWPSMLTLGVVLYATLTSDPLGDDAPVLFAGADKLIHAVMMGGLTGAIAFDIYRRQPRPRSPKALTLRLMLCICCCVCAFSALDEAAQSLLTDNRATDPLDLCADCVGSLAAVWLAPPTIRKVLK